MRFIVDRAITGRFVVILCALAGCATWCSQPALAAKGVVSAFGGEGAGDGQFANAQGVAVDQSSGEVYVVDGGNDRVQVFSATGAYLAQFGGAGAGAGQLSEPQGVAVEQAFGNVYVTSQGNHRVDEFTAGGGFVRAFGWGVGDGVAKLEVCTSTCEAGQAGSGAGQFAAGSPTRVAVDPTGYVYALDGGNSRLEKFTGSGAVVAQFASAQLAAGSPMDVAVDPATGDVDVAGEVQDQATKSYGLGVLQFDSTGDLLVGDAEGANLPGASGLAVASSGGSGDIYYSSGGRVLILGDTSPVPPAGEVQAATGLTTHEATLNATVDPNESAPDQLQTSYRLQYSSGAVNANGEVEWTTASEGQVSPGTSPVPVAANVDGLLANTSYRVRVLSEREFAAGGTTSPEGVLTTRVARPAVGGESFSDVTSKGATVSAQVSGEGLPTTYYVEYGTTVAYGSKTAEATLPFTGAAVTATAQLTGLTTGSEYHFRVIATNADGTAEGADTLFSALPVGVPGLPDGRAYEMVTPVENENAEVYVPESYEALVAKGGVNTDLPFQASVNGDAVAYLGGSTAGGNGEVGFGLGIEYLATRSPGGGWTQVNLQPQGSKAAFYEAFSSDLSVGFLTAGICTRSEVPALSSGAPGDGYTVLYERSTNSKASYQSLFAITPPNRGSCEFGAYDVPGGRSQDLPAYAGSSANLQDLLFEANDALLEGGGKLEKELTADVKKEVGEGKEGNYLYDSIDGRLSLVDVLPDGAVAPDATFGGQPLDSTKTNPPDFSHVISEAGTRVFWTAASAGEGDVYVRENGTSTVPVSEGPAQFWTATPDGRYAFYTEGQKLYRFDTESETREELTGADTGVLGVIGASNAGDYVYFVAEGQLAAGATQGQPNLYVLHSDGGVWGGFNRSSQRLLLK